MKAKIVIKVNDRAAEVRARGKGSVSLLVATVALVQNAAQNFEMTETEFLELVREAIEKNVIVEKEKR